MKAINSKIIAILFIKQRSQNVLKKEIISNALVKMYNNILGIYSTVHF